MAAENPSVSPRPPEASRSSRSPKKWPISKIHLRVMNDLRFAFRQLIKYPGFTLIAIFALALGIGANTAIFSMVNAVLLRPLPYPEADKLILIRECSTAFARGAVGYMNWVDWHASQRSFTDLALVRRENFNFSMGSGVGAPERIKGIRVSARFLSTIGIKPELGRDLTTAEDLDGAPNVALISDSLWRKHFGASPEVLGKHVVIDGLEREIVGVYPPELQFGRNPDVVIPLGEIVTEEGMQTR